MPALAQEQAAQAEPESEALAKEAQQAVLEHCAAAAGTNMRPAREALLALSDVWVRVNARVEDNDTVPLRYWQAVITHCMGQEARAAEDFDTFIKAHKGDARWTEMVADAEQRMARLSRQEQKRRPETAALKAAEILDQYCEDVAAGKATESAQVLSAVGPVLAEVSAAHDQSGAPYLLYWRGRLNLCLDREDRAEQDLELFVQSAGDDAAYRRQAQEARALLRRVSRSRDSKVPKSGPQTK